MMLQVVQVQAGLIANSGGGGPASEPHESGGRGSGGAESIAGEFSEDDRARTDEGERNSRGGSGNRWPRQETLALLKLRSDMDAAFRDSSFKVPLWEEVCRKMAELGYHRSSKKCKEKFENVYKYHKRTRDSRTSKADRKTYRFFDQLQALDHHKNHPSPLPPPPPATSMAAMPIQPTPTPPVVSQLTVPSMANTVAPIKNPTNPPLIPPSQPPTTNPHQNVLGSFISNSTSSSTSSDEGPKKRMKRKRKWKIFFERLMKDVIEKQDEMQKKFLETMERRELERMTREEAWRVQEMGVMNRQHEHLVQERYMAATKDAALIAFLKKVTEQQPNPINPNASSPVPQMQLQLAENSLPAQKPPQQQTPPPTSVPTTLRQQTLPPPAPILQQTSTPLNRVETPKAMANGDGRGENLTPASSSRWPKAEVQALIRLRMDLDLKYQESAPKGPLWEDISAKMRKFGYNRNAKRCKEKWENINKYFKKVKERNKKRPEDSKTCPYFYQLDALYKEKAKNDASSFNSGPLAMNIAAENPMVPMTAQPEQQSSLPQEQRHQPAEPPSGMDVENDHDDEDVEDDEEEDDDDERGGCEILRNKITSAAATMNY